MNGEFTERVQVVEREYKRKIRRLNDHISGLEQKLEQSSKEGGESHRSRLIKSQQDRIRDLETVTDFLKKELSSSSGGEMDEAEINSLIIRKTCGAPRRFGPPSREELESKVRELERALKRSKASSQADRGVSSAHGNRKSDSQELAIGDVSRRMTLLEERLLEAREVWEKQVQAVAAAKASQDLVQRLDEELERARRELAYYQQQSDELSLRVEQAEAYKESGRAWKLKWDQSVRRERELEKEAHLLRARLEEGGEAKEQQLSRLEERVRKLTDMNAVLRKEVEESESAGRGDQVTQVLRGAPSDASLSSEQELVVENRNYRQKVNKLGTHVERLKRELEETMVQLEKMDRLRASLRDANLKNREVQRDVGDMAGRVKRTEEKLREERKERDGLRDRIGELEERLARRSEEGKEAEQGVESALREELAELREDLAESERRKEELLALTEELRDRISVLETTEGHFELEREQIVRERQELEEELVREKAHVKRLQEQVVASTLEEQHREGSGSKGELDEDERSAYSQFALKEEIGHLRELIERWEDRYQEVLDEKNFLRSQFIESLSKLEEEQNDEEAKGGREKGSFHTAKQLQELKHSLGMLRDDLKRSEEEGLAGVSHIEDLLRESQREASARGDLCLSWQHYAEALESWARSQLERGGGGKEAEEGRASMPSKPSSLLSSSRLYTLSKMDSVALEEDSMSKRDDDFSTDLDKPSSISYPTRSVNEVLGEDGGFSLSQEEEDEEEEEEEGKDEDSVFDLSSDEED